MRALISVSDKTGIVEFAKGLADMGVEIISTGGTHKKLEEAGIKVIIPNGEFYASKICDTFEEAIDLSVEALEKQLVKHKEKQRSK